MSANMPISCSQYVHLGIGQFGFTANGQLFSYVFCRHPAEAGYGAWPQPSANFDLITLRRMPWIRQGDRDFRAVGAAPDSEAFISRIEVEDWQREPEHAVSLSDALEVHEAG